MKKLELGIKSVAIAAFFVMLILFFMSVYVKLPVNDASAGDFETESFNDGWTMSYDDTSEVIDLPYSVKGVFKKDITLSNTLPDYVSDGMTLCFRSDLQNVKILVDGEVRNTFDSDGLKYIGSYPPGAYMFVKLSSKDAGKIIEIELNQRKSDGNFNEITIGYGYNAWYDIIRNNYIELIAAIIMLLAGFTAFGVYFIIRFKYCSNKSILYLAFTIVNMSVWILSESKIRQLFLKTPSLSMIFCYISLEVMAVFILIYFDEIQNKNHHKVYIYLEILCIGQFIINTIMFVTKIADYHETLVYSHICFLISMIGIFCIIYKDIRSKKIEKYRINAIGMIFFLIFAGFELLNFYLNISQIGVLLCVGFLIMLGATILQIISDMFRKEQEQRKHIEQTIFATIETIAGSIDAKDEYTGGHSERVAHYASVLARNVADEYGFTEKDILEIYYVALMHDIGKIAIPDTILNKAGRLTEDEFVLMKKHAAIGDELLKDVDTIKGLSDGVRHHHERYDGKGYPDGLEGEEIPLIARILCLADCYDAMTSNRVYRTRLSDEKVRYEIERCEGTQFDPKLARAFCKLIDSGEMKPLTQQGLDVSKSGHVLKSSILRHLLVENMKNGKNEISNPSYVRMVSYIMKMAEKKQENVFAYLFSVDAGAEDFEPVDIQEKFEKMKNVIDPYVSARDISIEYSKSKQLVVWIDNNADKIQIKLDGIKKNWDETAEIVIEEVDMSL